MTTREANACHSERRPRLFGARTVAAKHVLSLSKGNLGRGVPPFSRQTGEPSHAGPEPQHDPRSH